ncbi:MAG: C39 family peptidase [Eubacteriales bacterium]
MKKKMLIITMMLMLLLSTSVNALAATGKVLSVPNVAQPSSSNWCWAASVKAVIQFKKGTSPSMSDICYVAYGNRDLNQFGDVDAIKKALNYYGVTAETYLYNLPFISNQIEINYDRPVIATLQNGAFLGHAITIKGYDTSYNGTGNYAGWYMDPYDGLTHVSYWYPLFDTGGIWPGGSWYNWDKTVWHIGQ